MRIAFPVLDDIADVEYHIAQRKQNFNIEFGALGEVRVRFLGASKRWKFCHNEETFDVFKTSSPPTLEVKLASQLEPKAFFSSKILHFLSGCLASSWVLEYE